MVTRRIKIIGMFVLTLAVVAPNVASADWKIYYKGELARGLASIGDRNPTGGRGSFPTKLACDKARQEKMAPSVFRDSYCAGTDSPAGADAAGGLDLSGLSPGQQMAVLGMQLLLKGIFGSMGSSPTPPAETPPAVSAEETLRKQQEVLMKQEEDRVRALKSWNDFQADEQKRRQAEQDEKERLGKAFLDRTAGKSGEGLGFQAVSGGELGFAKPAATDLSRKPVGSGTGPARNAALEQLRCAAYFSDMALKTSNIAEARFLSLQSEKAMNGTPTDIPCQAAAAPVVAPPNSPSLAPGIEVNAVLDLYGSKAKELLEISEKLSEVRRQKIKAEYDVKSTDARILDIKNRSATVTRPEEKQQLDTLLEQAMALRSESEARLKTAAANEKDYLTKAKQAEDQVKDLNSKLQPKKDGK